MREGNYQGFISMNDRISDISSLAAALPSDTLVLSTDQASRDQINHQVHAIRPHFDRSQTNSPAEPFACVCGCGRMVDPKLQPGAKYFNENCRQKAYRERAKNKKRKK